MSSEDEHMSDYDEDVYENSETEPKVDNVNKPVTNSQAQVVSTEGSDFNTGNLKNCMICNKFYNDDMIVDIKFADETCYHCYYWMNYSMNERKKVDGQDGKFISDYINKCKDIHLIDNCKRRSDAGGCFLCEHLLGLPIDGVKNYKSNNTINEPMYQDVADDDDDGNISDYEGNDKITIYI
jgi:hypothetical protein